MAQADSCLITKPVPTAPVRAKRAKSPPKPEQRQPRTPADLPSLLRGRKPLGYVEAHTDDPNAYALRVTGDCLAPEILNDDDLVISPAAELHCGMVAMIMFRGASMAICKRLVTVPPAGGFKPPHPDDEVSPVLIFAMDNPPKQFIAAGDKIEAVHGVIGRVRDGVYTALTPRGEK